MLSQKYLSKLRLNNFTKQIHVGKNVRGKNVRGKNVRGKNIFVKACYSLNIGNGCILGLLKRYNEGFSAVIIFSAALFSSFFNFYLPFCPKL